MSPKRHKSFTTHRLLEDLERIKVGHYVPQIKVIKRGQESMVDVQGFSSLTPLADELHRPRDGVQPRHEEESG